MLTRISLGDTHHAFPIRIAHEPAVDAGEAFLFDLAGLGGNDLLAGAGAKVEGDDLSRPCAKTLGHIIAGYDEILAGLVVAADDDMAVGVACRSEEHTSELQSLMRISYAVFCLQQKKKIK